MQGRVIGKVELLLGQTIRRAEMANDQVRLIVQDARGALQEVLTEHVIAATGYKVNLDRYQFLGNDVRAGLQTVEATPVLNRHFESSVPGLYFIGPPAANSFGPLMRFAAGAGFAAHRAAADLYRSRQVVAPKAAGPSMDVPLTVAGRSVPQ
jgi:thioredoxin reductase